MNLFSKHNLHEPPTTDRLTDWRTRKTIQETMDPTLPTLENRRLIGLEELLSLVVVRSPDSTNGGAYSTLWANWRRYVVAFPTLQLSGSACMWSWCFTSRASQMPKILPKRIQWVILHRIVKFGNCLCSNKRERELWRNKNNVLARRRTTSAHRE